MLTVTEVSPVLGAEVHGANLRNPADHEVDLLRDAWARHGVLFFRDQPALEPSEQVAFARRFGALHTHPAAPTLDGHPEVFVIHTHAESRVANGNGWHTDVSCDVEPPLGTMLQLHVLPPSGGDTLFASMTAAYRALSAPIRRLLAGLTALHESEHVYRGRYADRGVDDAGREYPSAEHPILRTHAWTGETSIYVNRAFTTRIPQLSRRESDALLAMLFDHVARPEFQIRFTWSENAIALWDNRCLQHFAMWDYHPHERRGHRVTILGEKPYYDPAAETEEAAAPVGVRVSGGGLA